MKKALALAFVAGAATFVAGTAQAQTIPHTSHHLSFNAPQLRKHGSGLHRPNRPTHHHVPGFAGYKPVYPEIDG